MADTQLRYSVGFDIDKSSLNQLKTSLQDLQKLSLSDFMKLKNSDVESSRKILQSIRTDASHVEQALTKAFNIKLNSVNISEFNK